MEGQVKEYALVLSVLFMDGDRQTIVLHRGSEDDCTRLMEAVPAEQMTEVSNKNRRLFERLSAIPDYQLPEALALTFLNDLPPIRNTMLAVVTPDQID